MVEKDTRMHGSCLCRAAVYAVADCSGPMWHCHCLICHKLSGAAFVTHVEARASDFSWRCSQDLLNALGPVFPLVQEIMAAHGGTLAVESALGCGTTFTMTLSTVDA